MLVRIQGPLMHQVPSDPSLAVIAGDFDGFTPESLFDHFTQPELLTKWWNPIAEIDLKPGGKYVFQWPQQGWTLRGEYLAVEPARHLAFTWAWDHGLQGYEPLRVDLWMDRIHEVGARLGIFHGPFELTEADQVTKQGVAEGWIHFCMRLRGLGQ
jgi:uncharacterized protein YndB with AHSA1/START domain